MVLLAVPTQEAFEFATHRPMGTNRLLCFNYYRKVEVTTLLSVSKKSIVAVRSSSFKIVRWMNTSKKYREISVQGQRNFVSFVTSFDVAFLEDIYMHVTKANCSGSELHHRIVQICQLMWMGYGCALASVSIAQSIPTFPVPQFQKCLATTDSLWSFHHISRILYWNDYVVSFLLFLCVCVFVSVC